MKPQRNDPCPCGSGRKFKKCCGSGAALPGVDAGQAFQLAAHHYQTGNLGQAEAVCRQILGAEPGFAPALDLLGVIAFQTGHADAAEGLIRRAIQADGAEPGFHNNLGLVLWAAGKFGEAADCCRRAIALRPDFAEAHLNLGNALRDQGKFDESIGAFRQAVALKPGLAEGHYNLGDVFRRQDRLEEAAASYRCAVDSKPDCFEAYNGLGCVFHLQGRPEQAVAAFQRAAELKPDYAEAYKNLGIALYDQGRLDEAVAAYQRAIAARQGFADAHWNRSLALLALGNLHEGWNEYEWRWKRNGAPPLRPFHQPLWDGSSLMGKTILVWGEQGVGDEILFAGLVPDVVSAAGHCIVECDPRLAPIFSRSFPSAEVIARSDPAHPRTRQPDIRFQSPAGSLPRWLRNTLACFPARTGYLKPDPERLAYWRNRLATLGSGHKVGICWRSMARGAARDMHYTRLSEWRPILTTPGVVFVNLQYDECGAELAAARQDFGVEIHRMEEVDLLNDLDQAAALTGALDLVISPATSVAAMAGAIGVPVWRLQTGNTWDTFGADHVPWYPNMRLFIRALNEDWSGTLALVSRELASWAVFP